MSKEFRKNVKGFTIIEVMIVLAIAALILLAVFLAVPALQRNSRNTQRKHDIGNLLTAITVFESNNSGTVPTIACGSNGSYKVSTGSCATPGGTPAAFKMGFYTSVPAFLTGTQSARTTDVLQIAKGAKCTAAGGSTATGAAARSIAALFTLESGSRLVAACQES